MSLKLTKAQIAQHETIINALQDKYSALQDAAAAYEAACEEAEEFAHDIGQAAADAIDEKSERWQEGDKGQAAAEWAATWSDFEAEMADLVECAAEAFSELSPEPDA